VVPAKHLSSNAGCLPCKQGGLGTNPSRCSNETATVCVELETCRYAQGVLSRAGRAGNGSVGVLPTRLNDVGRFSGAGLLRNGVGVGTMAVRVGRVAYKPL